MSAALWCLLELQIIFHLTEHKVCCSTMGRLGKISHLLRVSLVTFSPLCPASFNGADMFSLKLPEYICQQLSVLMESPAVFLKSTIPSLAATKSITAKKKKNCVSDTSSANIGLGNSCFAPGSVAQGSKYHWMSAQSVSLEALESIIPFS